MDSEYKDEGIKVDNSAIISVNEEKEESKLSEVNKIDELTNQNHKLSKKVLTLEMQVKTLCDDKLNLENKVQMLKEDNNNLGNKLQY